VELGRRGRERQLEIEDEYWKLILAGVGTVEACRQVEIGSDWPSHMERGCRLRAFHSVSAVG
jgi:hypothetical protein